MADIKVLFVGNDAHYYKQMRELIERLYHGIPLSFATIPMPEGKAFKEEALKIYRQTASIIFLDLSSDPSVQIRFCQFLSRSLPFSQIPLVGMLDTTLEVKYKRKIIGSGIWALHMKGIELEGSAYLMRTFLEKEKAQFPTYATTRLEFKAEVSTYVRIGYVTPTYIHIESDLNFPLDSRVSLLTNLSEDFPFTQFTVKRKMESNLYYHYPYAYDLEYALKDKKEFWGKVAIEDEEGIAGKKQGKGEKKEGEAAAPEKKPPKAKKLSQTFSHYSNASFSDADEAEKAKKRSEFLAAWPKTWPETKSGKRTRMLIIDDDFGVLSQSKTDLDELSLSISAHAAVDPEGKLVERIKAGIIVYVFEERPVVETPEDEEVVISPEQQEKNNKELAALKSIISRAKSLPGYTPFFILFNAPMDTETLAQDLGYPSLMAHETPLDFDLCLQYAYMYEEKGGRKKTHDQNASYHDKEKRWYLSKNLVKSYGKLKIEIKFKVFSEMIVEFDCPVSLPERCILRLDTPYNLFISVMAKTGKEEGYRGMIHGVSEITKVKIRRTINGLIGEEKHKGDDEE